MKGEVRRAKCKALICFAVKAEAAGFSKVLHDFPEAAILVTGMGKKNSENSFRQYLETSEPRLVLTCGFAGALNPQFKIGDVIFSTGDLVLADLLCDSGAVPAKFFCAERVVITASEKEKRWQETKADAVEMESEIIHELCSKSGIPCATVRVISDVASEDLPLDFNALMTRDQKISFGKLGLALAKSPQTIPRLLQLQRNTRLGARRLSEALEKLLRAWRNG